MRVRAAILLTAAALTLGGCTWGQSARHWPTYVTITHSILETELGAELVILTDEQVTERIRVMERLTPVLRDTVDLADRYLDDLEDERDRRGL